MAADPIMDEIYEARIERGIGLRDLAERAGVPPSNLSEWERGNRSPTLRSVRRLADALGLRLVLAEIGTGDGDG